ncbi:hypothetical protein, partial [Burkholderia sp.]|uniref:hypothetical protein n=1 Tax=Burkholderia sp. TaxID=36773 RepID=UPI0025896F73
LQFRLATFTAAKQTIRPGFHRRNVVSAPVRYSNRHSKSDSNRIPTTHPAAWHDTSAALRPTGRYIHHGGHSRPSSHRAKRLSDPPREQSTPQTFLHMTVKLLSR